MGREWRRLWRARLSRARRACVAALSGSCPPVSAELIALIRSTEQPPSPPPGHPERAVPHVPPSPVEQELWADLVGRDRAARHSAGRARRPSRH